MPSMPSRFRLPPLVVNSLSPERFDNDILPPLVDKSVEAFLGTYILKEKFSAFFQSVILCFDLAVTVSSLFFTETSKL